MKTQENINWEIEGMTCHTCSLNIKSLLEKEGMQNVKVSYVNKSADFTPGNAFNEADLKKKIASIGYEVQEQNHDGHEHHNHSHDHTTTYLIICAAFTFPLLLHMVFPFPLFHNPLFQLLLCMPVMYLGTITFGKSAFNSLKNFTTNMDVLIMVGSSAAFVYSVYGAIIKGNTDFMFFETAASIITFVMLGEWIEHRSTTQTNTAVKELAKLQVSTAKLLVVNTETGEETFSEIESAQIMMGHRLQVNTGDSIPTDGIILRGEISVDESMLTGESEVIKKQNGDTITGGTIVMNGSAILKATATGKQTTLSKIIELVKQAQSDLPPIQKLADKISSWFVPTVLLISISTFLISYFIFKIGGEKSLMHSIAVLVISCPCAMGLATPLAVMVGIGKAAKKGILFKGSTVMEQLAKSSVWIFDKTGTLTSNEIDLEKLNLNEETKSILYSVEQHSSHPIAKQMVKQLVGTTAIRLKNIEEKKGEGIIANDDAGNSYMVGKPSLAGITGNEQIYVFKNKIQLATFSMQDQLKENAKDLIDFCKTNNITPVLLSGDKKEKCDKIAAALGIEKVYAEQSPSQKLQIINQFKQTHIVAMIGDGVNDAPALASAHIGVSLSNATQVAIETASVILLRNNLLLLTEAFTLAKSTVRTIHQNLFWAFAYNIVAIPVAGLGFLSPMFSALSMAFSDVVLVLNSLWLKWKR